MEAEENTLCECPMAGFCKRHQVEKSTRQRMQCAESPAHFQAWERVAKSGVTATPAPAVKNGCGGCNKKPSLWQLGDKLEEALSAVGITKARVEKYIGDCGCSSRQVALNKIGSWLQRALTGESGKDELETILEKK